MSRYYLLLENEVRGPYEISQLRTMWSNGAIHGETPLCLEGDDVWSKVKILGASLEAAKPTVARPQQGYLSAEQRPGWGNYLLNKKSAVGAMGLNFVLPGLGYLYCGRIFLGLMVIAFYCLCLYIAICGVVVGYNMLGIIWIIGLIDGYLCAERANLKLRQSMGLL